MPLTGFLLSGLDQANAGAPGYGPAEWVGDLVDN